ncbi:MAG: aminotransferase class V-fold PLP-dependent enzyme [Chloroflexi bacterium]|nr:aminotransferase class V-fold PLP-dependent enzyme [Chloroflexota bacterium]
MREVYLDNVATTPLLPEVLEAMLPFLKENFGNPQSLHQWGDAPREAMEDARRKVAALINAQPEEILFTASGTESNNFAIKGLALAGQTKGKHVIVSAVEHFSVLYAARTLEKWGFEVTVIPVDKYGVVNIEKIKQSIRKDTILISVMHANTEVGTIQPIKEITAITKAAGVPFHCDAVGTVGVLPVDVKDLGVDTLSLAGSEFYGPKGSGALWVRRGVRVMPLLDGGTQEGGRRPGTENIPAIVGLGKAAELAKAQLHQRFEHYQAMRDHLLQSLPARIERSIVTGHPTQRLPNNASFCIEFIEGESMLMLLSMQGVAAASGSTCSSKALKASHVLTAMGVPSEITQGSLLFTLGIQNTMEDIDYVLETLPPIVRRLRQMSPLYAKFIKGQRG